MQVPLQIVMRIDLPSAALDAVCEAFDAVTRQLEAAAQTMRGDARRGVFSAE